MTEPTEPTEPIDNSAGACLARILAEAAANRGKMPPINPPQAQAVLETKTAAEVAGQDVPDLPPAVVQAPVARPPEVVAAEAAPKVRRTAAVVQAELDAANEENAALHARIGELAECAGDDKALEAAKDMVASLTEQLRTSEAANESAAELILKLQAEKGKQDDLIKHQAHRLTNQLNPRGPADFKISGDESIEAMHAAGFTVQLTYRGAE